MVKPEINNKTCRNQLGHCNFFLKKPKFRNFENKNNEMVLLCRQLTG